jgi:hypothetical protein
MCQNLDLRFLHFIAFCQVFFHPFFVFFWLSVLLSFLFFYLIFLLPFFSPSFSFLFYTCFFDYVVSSLAYPNLFGNKRLDCCCCCCVICICKLWHLQVPCSVKWILEEPCVERMPQNLSSWMIVFFFLLNIWHRTWPQEGTWTRPVQVESFFFFAMNLIMWLYTCSSSEWLCEYMSS